MAQSGELGPRQAQEATVSSVLLGIDEERENTSRAGVAENGYRVRVSGSGEPELGPKMEAERRTRYASTASGVVTQPRAVLWPRMRPVRMRLCACGME